jgi:hypothetical protein
MSDVISSVGTLLSVSASSPATYDIAGFEALTFSLVAEASEIPELGGVAALATHTPLATGIVAKRRGSINYGSITVPMALSAADTGQGILRTAGDTDAGEDAQVSCKVERPNGNIEYFTAQVMSFTTNTSNADAITMSGVVLEIDGKVLYDTV